MTLHGNITVNAQTVGYWEAKRRLGERDTMDRGVHGLMHRYDWTVILFDEEGKQSWKGSSSIWHYENDGAMGLTSKVLEAALSRQKVEERRERDRREDLVLREQEAVS